MWRKSIKEYIQQAYDDMHEAVVTGIKWYTEFFGTPFPWDKYDQIFCPEFKYGAMENVGAVTFSEGYIPTGKLTEIHLTRLQNTWLHELCHQWFGNLWTMKWWDDLWLNEAFATYMAYLCTSENEKLFNKTPGLWIALNTRKVMASNSDTLSTTHPIKKEALTTDSADDMVNAITYGKGSSFIKQLIHMISRKAMSKACQIYFTKYAWNNSVLDDFIEALIQGCGEANPDLDIDIRSYCIDFLTTKGINSLSSKVEQQGEDIKITFIQKQGLHSNSLNMQKVDYQLYDKSMKFEQHSIILEKGAETQSVIFKNRKADDTFVLLNADDHAYFLINIEKNFINKFIEGDLWKINSSINRAIVWRGLNSMVRGFEIKPMDYIEIVMNNIFNEDDIILLDTILGNLHMFINTYVPDDKFSDTCTQLFEKLYERYSEIPDSNKDLKNVIKSALFCCIYDEKHIKMVVGWLEDDSMELSAADKETILTTMFRSSLFTSEEKHMTLNKYVGDNASDRMKRLKITWEAYIPDRENKAKVWEIVTHPKEHELSSYDYRAYLEGFHSRFQIDLNKEYVDKFIEEVPKFARSGEKDHMTIFVSGAFPPIYYMNQEFFDKIDAIVAEFENEDKVKYDSFLKLIKSMNESRKAQVVIKNS